MRTRYLRRRRFDRSSRSPRLLRWLGEQATRLGLSAEQVFNNLLDGNSYQAVGRFAAPANTVLPAITGTAQVGQTLTRSLGTWTGDPTPTFTTQWKRDGVNIAAATASTYALVIGDLGAEITVTVTATNAVDDTSATSAPTADVVAA